MRIFRGHCQVDSVEFLSTWIHGLRLFAPPFAHSDNILPSSHSSTSLLVCLCLPSIPVSFLLQAIIYLIFWKSVSIDLVHIFRVTMAAVGAAVMGKVKTEDFEQCTMGWLRSLMTPYQKFIRIRYGVILQIRSHDLECKMRFFKNISKCVRVKSET